ncbi:PQQ-binding-like beta-propeller repeat protein [Aliifodinibius sp. S!AR15-10]|uniref:outer membrane protein assembly factor BamB family protein n=1 Tax=Aliifodinibius sp. S!AR15-10 TaxID=2950437 RepID=UPI002856E82C|nr:PQQ-binding-like beta-propeller repeat protein [Aliifodinibius sp. S!AR15-10]MDR8394085.1 PQQ-binding-like beta-propeller repeat protein [Aliifodinibius sp. S!AR15-10]
MCSKNILPAPLGSAMAKLGLVLLVSICVACQPQQDLDHQYNTWEDYGGGPDNSKFVDLNGIDRANVGQLEQAWFYPTGDDNTYQFNPLVVDTVMYVLAKNNSLVALDAKTGEEIWIHADLRGMARRGINYWESDDGTDKRLLFQMNDYLQAIDAETGESILSFGENGLVDLRQGLGRDPKTISRVQSGTPGEIHEDLLILGSAPGEGYLSAPGHIRAFNVVTGEQEWIFHTIPHPGEFGYDTWPKGAYKYIGGVNTWAEMSVDKERGIVYLPLGSPTYDYYGADRIGRNLFGTSLLALDAITGEYMWHYQLVHHDLWDYDPAAAPQLVTVNHEGEQKDVVAVAGKTGFLYVFDRVTGEPLWPIEERPVPESEVPGEQTWPTQPFPTKPEPFSRHTVHPDSLNPFFLTDAERAEWKAKIEELEEMGRTSLFTPLSHQHETIAMPGAVGGANWGNTAADPKEGMVYVISLDWPSVYPKLEKREFGEEAEDQSGGWVNPIEHGQKVYAKYCQACHGADRTGIASAPSLIDMETRLSADDFQQIMNSGRGKMPSFSYLNEQDIEGLYRFLGGTRDGAIVEPPEGPVVAKGGAPGGQDFRPAESSGGRLGPPYPEGVEAPSDRYYLQGWGLGFAHIMSPPWSSIVAYDLNEGVIKWRRPLGSDKLAEQEGGKNTGVLKAQRNGMIVTSTGLLFSTAGDGKVYAFDAETGEELWVGQLPKATEGLPTMYEVDGKYYLAVPATSTLEWGIDTPEYENEENVPQGGYVVFSLSE